VEGLTGVKSSDQFSILDSSVENVITSSNIYDAVDFMDDKVISSTNIIRLSEILMIEQPGEAMIDTSYEDRNMTYSSMNAHTLPARDETFLYNCDRKYLSMHNHQIASARNSEGSIGYEPSDHPNHISTESIMNEDELNNLNEESQKSDLLNKEYLDGPRIKKPGNETTFSSSIGCGVDEDNSTDENFTKSSHFMGENYQSRMQRVEGLRKIVENEIGEFEKHKSCDHDTNMSILTVKDIEFPIMINLHQKDNISVPSHAIEVEEFKVIKEEENSPNVPVELERNIDQIETKELRNIDNQETELVLGTTGEKIFTERGLKDVPLVEDQAEDNEKTEDTYDSFTTEQMYSERRGSQEMVSKYIEYDEINADQHQDNDGENVVEASCLLGENQPVVIKTCAFHSDDENVYEFVSNRTDDEKMDDLNTKENNKPTTGIPNVASQLQIASHNERSVNKDIKKRDQELLTSLMNTMKETQSNCPILEEDKVPNTDKKNKCKKSSSKVILAAKPEKKAKKETYKIKFKVNIGDGSHSKHSVLHYLFGCFGGQKLFTSSNI